MKLFFDTETTGLVNFSESPVHASQPRLVQLGAILTDLSGNEIFTLNTIIKPDGFEIPESASKIHGITTEKALKEGIYLEKVMNIFVNLLSLSSEIIGHNISYDEFIIIGEMMRLEIETKKCWGIPNFCTMKASTNICKIPSLTGSGYKWPRLQEAYKHAFCKEFEGAHDAMADIRATKELYFWLTNTENFSKEEPCPS